MSADPAMLGTSGYERIPRDFYPTPQWVTEALLAHVRLLSPVWEPAAGGGDMSAVLRRAGYRVVESDIAWPDPVDFFHQLLMLGGARSIVTNPPYDRIEEFIRHALELTRPVQGMVAILARHEFDCAGKRKDLFDRPPFAMKLVLTKRPRWVPRHPDDKSPRHNFSWLIWDWLHLGKPVLEYE